MSSSAVEPVPGAVPGTADWSDLRAFVEVAHQSSFSRAGSSLLLSQSTISRQVSRLERRFGILLFERTSRSVRLTPMGGLILSRLSDAVSSVEDILRTNGSRPGSATVRAVACHVPQELVLDGLVSLSGVEWVLGVGTVEQGLESVCDGAADHAVTLWFPQVRPIPVDRLSCRTASEVSLRVVVPTGVAAPAVRLRDLRDLRWAIPADEDLESAFRLACGAVGFIPDVRLRVPVGSDPAMGVRQGLAALVGPWTSAPAGDDLVRSPDLPTATLMITSRFGAAGVAADVFAGLLADLHRAA